MKNFTGKVTDVDNNGNPIKKKSGGKNGKKSGFKKPTAAKKSSGKKAAEGYCSRDDKEAGAQNCGILLFL